MRWSQARLRAATLVLVLMATESVAVPASSQSLSGAKLAIDPLRIDSLFVRFAGGPGCALGVYHDGRLAYAKGYGLTDLEHPVPITTRTIFEIASMSKQFTAAVVLLLAQRGMLSVEQDARELIPEFPGYEPPVTIRHLLHHASGVLDYVGLLDLAGLSADDAIEPRDALRLTVRQKRPVFAPGTKYAYSNSNYMLLAEIVSRASGKLLAEFVAQEVFEPLEMRSSLIHDGRARVHRPGRSG